jgi:hypothetical protein
MENVPDKIKIPMLTIPTFQKWKILFRHDFETLLITFVEVHQEKEVSLRFL